MSKSLGRNSSEFASNRGYSDNELALVEQLLVFLLNSLEGFIVRTLTFRLITDARNLEIGFHMQITHFEAD